MEMGKTILFALLLVARFQDCSSEPEKCPKYKVPDHSRWICNQCRLCDRSSKDVSKRCKDAYPELIGNQGYVWCTNLQYPLPSCPKWEVAKGRLNCSNEFGVGSKCVVVCDEGYSVVNNDTVQCTDDLHWSISENSRPWCHRTDPPGQPVITSSVVRTQVRAGSDVTLTCKNTTLPVGKVVYFWTFNSNPLLNDKHSNTYTIMAARREDEGIYRCVIQDQIGNSSSSLNYNLNVENSQDQVIFLTIAVIIAVMAAVLLVLGLTLCKDHIRTMCPSCTDGKEMKEISVGESWPLTNGSTIIHQSESSVITETETEEKTPYAPEPLTSQCQLSSKPKDITNEIEDSNLLPTVETPLSPPNSIKEESTIQKSSVPSDSQTCSKISELGEVANNDQRALAQLLEKKKVVDEIIKHLDRQPNVNKDCPTFKDLGLFLEMQELDIDHLLFKCQHCTGIHSPTYELLRQMKHEGKGFSSFREFLLQHNCIQLINYIQSAMNWDCH